MRIAEIPIMRRIMAAMIATVTLISLSLLETVTAVALGIGAFGVVAFGVGAFGVVGLSITKMDNE